MKTYLAGLCVYLLTLTLPVAASSVTQFGARPNDGRDDTEAFLAAFHAARTTTNKLIEIPAGQYHLRADGNPQNRSVLFPLTRVEGVTIHGEGAELLMSGPGALFAFNECSHITVEGLTVDWDRPTFSQGTVVAGGTNFFDVQVEPNFPVQGGEPVGAFMSYDPVTRLPYGKGLDVYGAVARTERIRPQVLRVHLNRHIEVPVGTLLVLRHSVYGHALISFRRCADVQVRDVTVFAGPGMGLVGSISTNIALQHFQILLRPGSGRMMSTAADATHFGGCQGTISLEDCTFEGMGDDGVNVKSGLYLTVRQRLDNHTVLCQHNLKMIDLPDTGDTMELAHTDTLIPFASGRVRSANLEPGKEHMHRVTFVEALPADLRVGDVLGNATRVPKFRMRHCTIRGNRARGVLCQTRHALIEDCTFRNNTSAGVLVLTEVSHFHESIGTRDVTVRNNVFENCNQGAASAGGALAALAWLKGSAYPPKPGVHRDVCFEGNRIIGTGGTAIFAVGVDGLTIRSNTVEQACLKPTRDNGQNAIFVLNCARVNMAANSIDPQQQGPGMKEAVQLLNSTVSTQ
ncbi:MAG: hypothetical protein EPN23_07970 [Verrucomicrobia bacterium]|nr:MAG: hypothetical protein EPN23_07970 [Verrucomicrobiota bacterium]